MSTKLGQSSKEIYDDEVKNQVARALSQDFRPWFDVGGGGAINETNEEIHSPRAPTRQDSFHNPGAFRVRGPGWEEGDSSVDATIQIGSGPSVVSGQTSIPSATASASRRIPYPIDETPKDDKHCLQSQKSRILLSLAVLLVLAGVVLGVVFGVVLKDNEEQPPLSTSNSIGPPSPAPTSAPTITMSPTSPKSWENAGEIIVTSDGATMAMSPSGTRVAVLDLQFGLTSGGSLEESAIVRVYNEEGGVWTQTGNFIEASSAVSLSLLGDRLAVGSVNASVGATVYELEDNDWSRIGNVIEGDAWTVALAREGNVLAVEDASRVQLYEWRGEDWAPTLDEALPTAAARTTVGSSYSRMAVDDESGTKVLVDQTVYQFSDNLDFFVRTGSILESDPPDTPVSMSGDGTVLAIAQPRSDVHGADNGGIVTVFWFDGTEWNVRGDPIIGDVENGFLGWSHSLTRNGRLITVMNNPSDSGEPSRAVVYTLQGSRWVPLLEGVPQAFKNGTISISHEGDRVGVGGGGIVAFYNLVDQ